MKTIKQANVSTIKPGDVVRGVSPDGRVVRVTMVETDFAPLNLAQRARTFRITWEGGSRRLLGASLVEVAR